MLMNNKNAVLYYKRSPKSLRLSIEMTIIPWKIALHATYAGK